MANKKSLLGIEEQRNSDRHRFLADYCKKISVWKF
jgi:hypothetical protein